MWSVKLTLYHSLGEVVVYIVFAWWAEINIQGVTEFEVENIMSTVHLVEFQSKHLTIQGPC